MNIQALLEPISPTNPSGGDLRYSDVYDQIKEARRADEPLEQGEWQTEIKTADWRQVAKLASKALKEKTKDLQIAVWLTEAWVHLHGYAGLKAGLGLICGLLNTFWATLYPLIEDGDPDFRIGPLMLLNEKLPVIVFRVPLCDPAHAKGYNYYQREESLLVGFGQKLDKEQKQRREALISEGKISGEQFTAAVNASPLAYYKKISRELLQCRETLLTLVGIVAEKFSPDPPGFAQLMVSIDACSVIANRILDDKRKSEFVPEEDVETEAIEKGSNPSKDTFDMETPATSSFDPTLPQAHAIVDISPTERILWQQVSQKVLKGCLKEAMDQLLSASALSPSIREKNRYLLLVAKLCLKAERADLARPIAEELYHLIETLQLEKWEHPSWIAEVVETLYRCLVAADELQSDHAKGLFRKLCLLSVTKAAAYRAAQKR